MNLNFFQGVISPKTIILIVIYLGGSIFIMIFFSRGIFKHYKKIKQERKYRPSMTNTLLYESNYSGCDCIKILKSKNIYDDREYEFKESTILGEYIITLKKKLPELFVSGNTIFKVTFKECEEKTVIKLEFIEANSGIRIGFFKETNRIGAAYWVDEFMIKKLGAKCI